MCRNGILLILVALMLGFADSALAADIEWTNADADNNWCISGNWNPEDVPEAGDTAFIDQITKASPDRGPIIGIGCDPPTLQAIEGPNPAYGHTQRMDVNTSGTLNLTGAWSWREGTGTGIVNINGNPTIDITGDWRGTDDGVSIINIDGAPDITVGALRGADNSGWFYLNMSSGHLDIDGEFVIGDNGGGDINMSGGTIIVGDDMDMGGLRGTAPININMTGGLIRVLAKFKFPGSSSRGGNIAMNLDGGVIDCNEFVHGGSDTEDPTYTDDWLVDIENDGELRIWGDVKDKIDANVAAGQITAYDGEGEVVVELVDGNTVVTALSPDPNFATRPDPRNYARNVDPNTLLSWTGGINASSHDVYLGTSWQDVNDATTLDAVYQGNVGPNEFDPGGLEMATMYYWRIDEVNSLHPDSPWKGSVWRFTTQSPIIDPHMRLWYKFNEPNGFFAHDSSGYGHDGAVDGPEELWDPDNGHDGGSRIFDDDGDAETVIDVPTEVLEEIDRGLTVIVWLKDTYDDAGNWVFDTGYGGENGPYHVSAAVLSDDRDVQWRAGNDSNDVLRHDVAAVKGWHHYAFVKDEIKDEMCIYFDGVLANSKTGVDDTLANVRGAAFKIGAATWSDNYEYAGKMDDLKVFDYAMSAIQVAADYRGGDLALAWAPSPGDFEEDVARDASLVWKPGNYADSHDVYIGTDRDDVNDANTAVTLGVFKGNQEPNEYDPPAEFELNTTYYWRIDEVNDSNGFKWKGNIWQFTVANFLIVDDMESYDPVVKRIYYTWADGIANGTGSEVGLGVKGADPVHGGEQSMKFSYDNDDPWGSDKYSEIYRIYPAAQDWTLVGVKILTLFFYGDIGNDANDTEQMYVGLEDTRGAISYAQVDYGYYGGDMNDVKKAEWTQWDIALSDFTGVDANNIKKVYIGFGDRDTPVAGGKGAVYFDDIRLYPPKCIPWRLKPAGDFTDDCKVDFDDLRVMALQWLRTDANLSPVVNPGTANLVGWWKLDENGGSTANDSSVYANHGTISGTYSWVTGHSNSAVEFINGKVLVPDAAQLKPAAQVSTSVWVYYSGEPGDNARVVVKGPDNFEAYCIELGDAEHVTYYVGDVNGNRYFADSDEGDVGSDEWLHLAGTYDGTTVKSYVNGQVAGMTDEANSIPLSQDPCGLAIANRSDANNRPFSGIVDEVRVYNRALTDAEVGWLASDGSGYVPLRAKTNLYDEEPAGQKAINFRDYTVLLESWLEEKLWPSG